MASTKLRTLRDGGLDGAHFTTTGICCRGITMRSHRRRGLNEGLLRVSGMGVMDILGLWCSTVEADTRLPDILAFPSSYTAS